MNIPDKIVIDDLAVSDEENQKGVDQTTDQGTPVPDPVVDVAVPSNSQDPETTDNSDPEETDYESLKDSVFDADKDEDPISKDVIDFTDGNINKLSTLIDLRTWFMQNGALGEFQTVAGKAIQELKIIIINK